jgi:hypothetical protein
MYQKVGVPLAVSILVLSSLSQLTAQDRLFDVSVKRHPTVRISTSEVDQNLGGATTILRSVDSPEDVSCPVTFRRSGDVTVAQVDEIPEIINGESDFDKIIAASGTIKLVGLISWCKGARASMILGCSSTPGTGMALVRYFPIYEQIIWAHEFGHTKGLNHVNNPRKLMNPSIATDTNVLDQSECAAFRGMAIVRAEQLIVADNADNEQVIPIDEFVRRIWIEGIRYEQVAGKYGAEVIPRISPLLSNLEAAPYWLNVVSVLGIVGGSNVTGQLTEFMFRSEPEHLLDAVYPAKVSVPIALGHLSARLNDPAPLDELIALADPNVAMLRIKWARSDAERAKAGKDIAGHAVTGLGLSGKDQAVARLQEVREAVTRGVFSLGGSGDQQSLIRDALGTIKPVKEHGLAQFYRMGAPSPDAQVNK